MLNEQKKNIDDVQCQWLPGQSEYSYFYNQNTIHKLVSKLFLSCDWRGLNWLYDKTCQWGGGHQVTSDNVITWSQAGTIPAHGWHQILCTLRQRLRTKTSTGRSFITAAVQTDQAATTHSMDKLKIVVIRRRHILEVIIKSKTNTEKRSSPVWV